jgi:hypothetical protein
MFSLLSPWVLRNEGHELQTSSDNHGGVPGTSPPSFLFGMSQRNTAPNSNPHGPMACLLIDRPIWKDVGVQPGGPFLHLLRVRGRSHGSGHGRHDHGRSGHGWLTFHGSFPGRKKGLMGGITTHPYIYTRMCVSVILFVHLFICMFMLYIDDVGNTYRYTYIYNRMHNILYI